MFKINKVNNYSVLKNELVDNKKISKPDGFSTNSIQNNFANYTIDNIKAYVPSFTAKNSLTVSKTGSFPSEKAQMKAVKSKLDKKDIVVFNKLNELGILHNNSSNDGTTVLNNLYKIATEPRLIGLSDSLILSEVINCIYDPTKITQKFGDIPPEVAQAIQSSSGSQFPREALNVQSSTCVATSMEFNLATKKPAEFARFVAGLSSKDYSVTKKLKMSDFSNGFAEGLWLLRNFKTDFKIEDNWEDVSINIRPDRNAIVRARVQSSYKDKGERSCVDVLVQSAILNLCSQHSYDSITDSRAASEFNSEIAGLSNIEKNFGEQVIFEKQIVSPEYQNIDNNGKFIGFNCKPEEQKQHIINSLKLGHNVITGYTIFDENDTVIGGHEITIVGYESNPTTGKNYFICNDTDDGIDALIKIEENQLLPRIHHAGILKEALGPDDVIVPAWRTILTQFQEMIKEEA